jgi:outer membrane lipoprotein-sorting protein
MAAKSFLLRKGKMKAKFLSFMVVLSIIGLAFFGCATATSSVKGTPTTINTMGGDTYNAIVIIDNIWEGVKVARAENGFLIYMNCITNRGDPGSGLMVIDGNKTTIFNPFPSDWHCDDVSVSQYGVAKYWSAQRRLTNTEIDSILGANSIVFRIIGSNAYMGKDGVDVTTILSTIKEFLQK